MIYTMAVGARFTDCQMTGSDLTGIIAESSNFLAATLNDAVLSNGLFDKAVFDEAVMRSVVARNGFFRRAKFNKTDISSADFTGADLTGVEDNGTITDQAKGWDVVWEIRWDIVRGDRN